MIKIPHIFGKLEQSTKDWLAQLSTKPNYNVVNAINSFIIQCKTDGNWNYFDRCWIFGQDIQANSKVCIKSYNTITEVNTPTWTQYQGYTGNGSSSYINTNVIPSTLGGNLSQNSMLYVGYSRTSAQSGGTFFGSSDLTSKSLLYTRYTDNKIYFGANMSSAVGSSTVANTDGSGLFYIYRNSSTNQSVYRNNSQLTNPAVISIALVTTSIYLLASNLNGSPTGTYSNQQISYFALGSANIDLTKLYNAHLNLKTSLGY